MPTGLNERESICSKNNTGFRYGWIPFSMLSVTSMLSPFLGFTSFYVGVSFRQALSLGVERWLLEIPGIDSCTFIPSRGCLFPQKFQGRSHHRTTGCLGLYAQPWGYYHCVQKMECLIGHTWFHGLGSVPLRSHGLKVGKDGSPKKLWCYL